MPSGLPLLSIFCQRKRSGNDYGAGVEHAPSYAHPHRYMRDADSFARGEHSCHVLYVLYRTKDVHNVTRRGTGLSQHLASSYVTQ